MNKILFMISICFIIMVSCSNNEKQISDMQDTISNLEVDNRVLYTEKNELAKNISLLNEELESVNELLDTYKQREKIRTQLFLNDPFNFQLTKDPFDTIIQFGEPPLILVDGKESKTIAFDYSEEMKLIYEGFSFYYIFFELPDNQHRIHEGVKITGNTIALKNGITIGTERNTVINTFGLPDYNIDSDSFSYYSESGLTLTLVCKNNIVSTIYYAKQP